VDGVDIGTADYGVFNLYDGTASIHDMTVGSSGMTTGANFLTAYWTYNQPILDIDGLTVEEAGGSGVYLYNQGTATTDSYINLHDLNFGTVAGNAVSLTYINAYNLSDSDLGSPSSYGLYAYGPGTTGTSTIENVTVDGASGSGIYLSGGQPTVVGVHSSANSAAGIHLDSATATVTDSTFTSNGTYGMECSSVTFTACTNNDLSDNAYGEVSGCPDTCGIPDGGADTGAP